MSGPFTHRALSPNHATPMDLDYLLQVVEAARRYGYNALQICGDTHHEGNLDGLVEFKRFPKANLVHDLEGARVQRETLRQVCRAAHAHGIEVYYWHHELWYPERLPEVYPDWFTAAPDNRFRRDLYVQDRVPRVEPDAPIWQFLDAKFDEAFAQLPELDGTIMTIQESRVPIYCLFEDFERQVEALAGLYRRLEAAHARVGKKWIIRTFAWREHEYRVVTEAVRRWRPAVPVESKGTAMDWHLFHPYDPLLGQLEGLTNHVEVAPSCEFYGCTRHPVAHPWFYTENVRVAAAHGHVGCAVRMDRAGVKMLGGPDEGVLACLGRFLNDPSGTDVGKVFVEWLMARYALDAGAARRLHYGVLENCWNATLRCYHQEKIYLGDSFWLGYDHHFFLAERDKAVEYDQGWPLAEKDQACAYADQAAATLRDLRGALRPEDYDDLTRRVRHLQLTCKNYRALVGALTARQRQMYEPSPANHAALAAAVDELEAAGAATERECPTPAEGRASDFGQRQPGALVVKFARAFRADLPNLPTRKVLLRLEASALGVNGSYRGLPAFVPPGRATTVALAVDRDIFASVAQPPSAVSSASVAQPPSAVSCGASVPPARPHFVLVLFAGTEMCVRRPLVVRAGQWEHRFDIGQFAWFLAHDRVRRYEVVIPTECFDADGRCQLQLVPPEPEHSPYIRELRVELETPAVVG